MNKHTEGKYSTPESRWAGVGPYYAMFPTRFADQVISRYTAEGDSIIDPFSGRGTSLFSAATTRRHALGVEINPVGWVYAATKLNPAERWRVEERIDEIAALAGRFGSAVESLPPFFRACFADDVLRYLLAARKHLNWRYGVIDRTVMTILLVDLHGKRDLALSNQMRQTKAMSPEYAIRWWRKRNLHPPERNVPEFLQKKIAWRYAKGLPTTCESRVYLADSTHQLPRLRSASARLAPGGARLLFTSPPYLGITNYHYDQWLRLWLLGGPSVPRSLGQKHRGKFCHPAHYAALLESAFTHARDLLAPTSIVYVRTDSRPATSRITARILREVFPTHTMTRHRRPLNGVCQTRLFAKKPPRVGEVDLVLLPPNIDLPSVPP